MPCPQLPASERNGLASSRINSRMGSDASLLCAIIFFSVVVPSPPKHQRMDRLNVQQKRLQALSSFARDWSHYQQSELHLNCHRPAHNTSTHVSLHYSGFATFVDECSSVDIDSTDTMFITDQNVR